MLDLGLPSYHDTVPTDPQTAAAALASTCRQVIAALAHESSNNPYQRMQLRALQSALNDYDDAQSGLAEQDRQSDAMDRIHAHAAQQASEAPTLAIANAYNKAAKFLADGISYRWALGDLLIHSSKADGPVYRVTDSEQGWGCSCPASGACWHICAALILERERYR